MYRVQEFAALAGVTVRALHHYDQLGLLKPLRRPGSGYRMPAAVTEFIGKAMGT